jgi:hypothetical protein
MVESVTAGALVSASQGVVSCELDGESALLDLDTSRYFRLNPVGTLVWRALAEPKTVSALQGVVLEAFDVEPERCARDLEALLAKLSGAGLVEISNAPAA